MLPIPYSRLGNGNTPQNPRNQKDGETGKGNYVGNGLSFWRPASVNSIHSNHSPTKKDVATTNEKIGAEDKPRELNRPLRRVIKGISTDSLYEQNTHQYENAYPHDLAQASMH
jgi:hypothetical protein